ncbi:hypothetical protein C9374_005891 [Naegleria lovaniensis]|uniref:Guanine nucleotide-binding protein subunit beta-like protein n=1 Tax=Naegleria lovaniensis TaxID=51637 RepID=A0AA88KHS1_NAELO|nr:uncharacterized protein C9374_005891 [Naegleria lovaniensis]KAG2382099.1 hypothetical protein C9374_005891 [Naegleria lovaniensis]
MFTPQSSSSNSGVNIFSAHSASQIPNLNLRITLSPFQTPTYIYNIFFSTPTGFRTFSFTHSGPDILIHEIQAPQILHTRTLRGHTNQISGLSFSKTNENMLISCSHDSTVRLWDLRMSDQSSCVQSLSFEGTTLAPQLNTVDLSFGSGYLYAVGSGQVMQQGSIAVGDLRKNTSPLSNYLVMDEIHSDCVNQVSFGSNNMLYSCSDDGLIHIYDISESNQKQAYDELEDSLDGALNVEDSVERFGFLGTTNCLYALSSTNHLHFWLYDAQEDEYADYRVMKREDEWYNFKQFKETSTQLLDMDAQDNLHFVEVTGSVGDDSVMLHASALGCVYVFKMAKDLKSQELVAVMRGGHSKDSLIRTVKVLNSTTLMTAGEDGKLCVFTAD